MKQTRPASNPSQTPKHVAKPTPELQEQVRRRAHEVYEQRGREEGHGLDDWLQAEAEVTQQQTKNVAA
jgi:Protein of unknown function (DUF2934)